MDDWPEIVRQHSPIIWRAIYRLLGNDAHAADCLQDTFMEAWNISRRDGVCNWPGLLQRLATQNALDRLRQRARASRRLDAGADPDGTRSPQPGPDCQVEGAELLRCLREALVGLPPQQAIAFTMCKLNGMSYEQAAEVLGVEVNTVGVLLHRARCSLAEVLGAYRDRG